MLKRFSPLVAMLLVLLIHSIAARAQVAARQQTQPLQLTLELLSQSYCSGNKLDILQMRLRLRYKNTGAQKLILYAGKNLFYQTRIRSIPREASARPYEVMNVNSRYYDQMTEAIDRQTPGKAFVFLAPGAVYEREILVGAGVAGEGAAREINTLAAGEHTLYIIASTWYESRKLAEELRGRWQRKGLLLIDPLLSEALKFNVGASRTTVKCQ